MTLTESNMKHPHKFEFWPFDEATNVAAFTTARVVEDGYPILQVSHDDDDGAWLAKYNHVLSQQ